MNCALKLIRTFGRAEASSERSSKATLANWTGLFPITMVAEKELIIVAVDDCFGEQIDKSEMTHFFESAIRRQHVSRNNPESLSGDIPA